MNNMKFDLTEKYGQFKIMNAVNNGPIHKRHTNDQLWDNFESFKNAKIPYVRNHDAALCHQYGGEFANDISAIFPDFSADENDPDSYDFACTDEYVINVLEAGSKMFSSIENRRTCFGMQ